MEYKQGDIIMWLIGGPPAEYDVAVVLNDNKSSVSILYQVYGEGEVHYEEIEKGNTPTGYQKIIKLEVPLSRWEEKTYKTIISISKALKSKS